MTVTQAICGTPGRIVVWRSLDGYQIEVWFGDYFDPRDVIVSGGHRPTLGEAVSGWFEQWKTGFGHDGLGRRVPIPTYWG